MLYEVITGTSADETPPVPDDAVSGTWEGVASTPDGELPFTLSLRLHEDLSVTGTLQSELYNGEFTGTWLPATSTLNGTLWPLFHGAIREPEYHRPWWRAYVAVNERFAEAA